MFESEAHNAILRQLQSDIESARYEQDGESLELLSNLRCMNQCLFRSQMGDVVDRKLSMHPKWRGSSYSRRRAFRRRPLPEHLQRSESLVRKDEAAEADLVPFEKYANAADGLLKPSSAARLSTPAHRSLSESSTWNGQNDCCARQARCEPTKRASPKRLNSWMPNSIPTNRQNMAV